MMIRVGNRLFTIERGEASEVYPKSDNIQGFSEELVVLVREIIDNYYTSDSKKIRIIKVVKGLTNMSLIDCKHLYEIAEVW